MGTNVYDLYVCLLYLSSIDRKIRSSAESTSSIQSVLCRIDRRDLRHVIRQQFMAEPLSSCRQCRIFEASSRTLHVSQQKDLCRSDNNTTYSWMTTYFLCFHATNMSMWETDIRRSPLRPDPDASIICERKMWTRPAWPTCRNRSNLYRIMHVCRVSRPFKMYQTAMSHNNVACSSRICQYMVLALEHAHLLPFPAPAPRPPPAAQPSLISRFCTTLRCSCPS